MTNPSTLGLGVLPGLLLAGLLPLSAASRGTLVIGHITSMSGAEAYIAPGEVPGLEDEVARINAAGGINGWSLKLVSYDIASNPVDGVPIAKRLITQDHAVAIIGPPYSGACIPLARVANDARVPVITNTGSNVNITVDPSGKVHPYMFRVGFVDPYQGAALADYCYTTLGRRKAAFIAEVTSPYTVGLHQFFQERFEKLGGRTVLKEGYTKGDQEFRALLAKVKNSSADVVVCCAENYKDPGLIAKQAKAMHLDIQMVGGDAWMFRDLLALAGKELEGACFTAQASTDDPAFATYNASYRKKHPGKEPNVWGYLSLDAMAIIVDAIRVTTAGNGAWNGAKFRDAIENTRNLPVFTTARFTFDKASHNPSNKPILMIQIKDSQFKILGSYTPRS